jgi:hypothetical protein
MGERIDYFSVRLDVAFIENMVTLTMLSRPADFALWLAYLVSMLSAIKWGWALIGCPLICIQLVALVWIRLRRPEV